ncbi:hypothetical protein [Caldibacillus thermoamylovorans]|uniref:hypothetical protein n=1 Tax=Caldibacillus thermoamylovorans TaxID=35841 RepID=UPI00203DB7C4|nr:hypothetical protein [Caldibacillus thermoamylovorans]MCM3053960.1 hypothetical protein [Caldibacillus thermoamylovorans]
MTTRSILVTVLSRGTPYFDDETESRHRFEVENSLFWRRNQFSSPFVAENPLFSYETSARLWDTKFK